MPNGIQFDVCSTVALLLSRHYGWTYEATPAELEPFDWSPVLEDYADRLSVRFAPRQELPALFQVVHLGRRVVLIAAEEIDGPTLQYALACLVGYAAMATDGLRRPAGMPPLTLGTNLSVEDDLGPTVHAFARSVTAPQWAVLKMIPHDALTRPVEGIRDLRAERVARALNVPPDVAREAVEVAAVRAAWPAQRPRFSHPRPPASSPPSLQSSRN